MLKKTLLPIVLAALVACRGGTEAQDPDSVLRVQMATPAPEIDTGGFLLYQPPLEEMLEKCASGPGSWTELAGWRLCGFAYATKQTDSPKETLEDDKAYTYNVQLWLARRSINNGTVQCFFRYGSEHPVDGNETNSAFTDGPLLYSLLLDPVTKKKVSKTEFEKRFRDECGLPPSASLPTTLTPDFRYFDVVEKPKN
jgi:hypothetical protein